MTFFKGILTDLRQRKLWPVPLALLAAIVAVPVVLAKQPQSTPVPPAPATNGPVSGTPVASIAVDNAPAKSRLLGHARDPFSPQSLPKPSTIATKGGGAVSATGGVTVAGGSGAVSGPGATATATGSNTGGSGLPTGSTTGTGGSGGSPASTPTPLVPAGTKPTPAPSGLAADQSYHVALSVSTPSGSVDALDPLTRLTPLPSAQSPLVIELGVLQGGDRVLFAVQPGTTVSGGGSCITGPIDCEIVSLAQDQVETATAGSTTVQFAVTAITADTHASVAAANAARQSVSKAGSKLIAKSPLTALSLYQYQPQVGALVDLQNLTVGGN